MVTSQAELFRILAKIHIPSSLILPSRRLTGLINNWNRDSCEGQEVLDGKVEPLSCNGAFQEVKSFKHFSRKRDLKGGREEQSLRHDYSGRQSFSNSFQNKTRIQMKVRIKTNTALLCLSHKTGPSQRGKRNTSEISRSLFESCTE